MTNAHDDYRQHLVLAEQKAQEDYDKTVLSLSGGALGISFAFIEKILGPGNITSLSYLKCAWLLWGLSITAVLSSYFFSRLALRKAINQVDANEVAQVRKPGGWLAWLTEVLNVTSGLCFLVGVVLITTFATSNLGEKVMAEKRNPTSSTSIPGSYEQRGYVPPPAPRPLHEDHTPPPPPPTQPDSNSTNKPNNG